MKASKLLKIIRQNLKDYPIDYLRNKATDDRYKDPLTKKLAKYNSSVYDEIYEIEIKDDFEIKDNIIKNIQSDIGFYFDRYSPGDSETREFTKNISLYLALISKKPLHPYTENSKDDVYYFKLKISQLKLYRSKSGLFPMDNSRPAPALLIHPLCQSLHHQKMSLHSHLPQPSVQHISLSHQSNLP